ncbi:flagellar assembly protein FliH [Zestomonas carbonaria]|uniref:Flagellar assembly protein FliH n=1 Tax=Zestomonas carbonaria TaxID=2762745 RepID=A0A7U7IBQ5_9GAMM|nr:flagellar assembly protein FliH [Pseudomonas carbonaria]CAD5110211.1 hypothetical protein PSEWESI4_04529 [Pseudomonas carbonaria]
MTVKVIRGNDRNWRPFRFPPRCNGPLPNDGDPASMQRAVADGFQQGIEKGYQDGLRQGLEAGQREGFDKGRQEGQRQGREEGRVQGRQAFEEAGQPLERISERLRAFLAEYELKRRQELLELVQKVARQVIRVELTLNPAQLLTLAEEALAAMPADDGEVQILLNPEECARIKDLAPERAAAWRLVPDERLALGECRVVTARAEADIGCQQRLDSCMETLSGHLLASEG